MTDIRLPASGNFKVRWHLPNAFANPAKPTPTEVNAGLHLGKAVSWNDWDFGTQASNTINDPDITSKSNVTDIGAAQYGGSISFYYPLDKDDNSNELALVRSALKTPRTIGFITIQIDGELSETSTPTYAGGLTQTAADGDLIHVYKVQTAGYTEVITGEEAFRYTINFLPKGEIHLNTVVATSLTVAITAADTTPAPGDVVVMTATVNSRDFTRGVRWSSSDSDVATVSQNGIVTIVGADTDTVTITASYEGATDTETLTVTA